MMVISHVACRVCCPETWIFWRPSLDWLRQKIKVVGTAARLKSGLKLETSPQAALLVKSRWRIGIIGLTSKYFLLQEIKATQLLDIKPESSKTKEVEVLCVVKKLIEYQRSWRHFFEGTQNVQANSSSPHYSLPRTSCSFTVMPLWRQLQPDYDHDKNRACN